MVGPAVRQGALWEGHVQNRQGSGRERLVLLGTWVIYFRLTPPVLLKYVFEQ